MREHEEVAKETEATSSKISSEIVLEAGVGMMEVSDRNRPDEVTMRRRDFIKAGAVAAGVAVLHVDRFDPIAQGDAPGLAGEVQLADPAREADVLRDGAIQPVEGQVQDLEVPLVVRTLGEEPLRERADDLVVAQIL